MHYYIQTNHKSIWHFCVIWHLLVRIFCHIVQPTKGIWNLLWPLNDIQKVKVYLNKVLCGMVANMRQERNEHDRREWVKKLLLTPLFKLEFSVDIVQNILPFLWSFTKPEKVTFLIRKVQASTCVVNYSELWKREMAFMTATE